VPDSLAYQLYSPMPMKDWKPTAAHAIATGGYLGYFPGAPGTVGSLLGVLIIWATRNTPTLFSLILLLLVTAAGTWASYETRRQFKHKDSPRVIVDEIAGMMLTTFAIPISWERLVFAFLLFRFFDIVKPFPASWIDRKVHAPWGIMGDDLVAGLFGNCLLHLAIRASI